MTHPLTYLELLLESCDVLVGHNLVHAVHFGPQVGSQNICLSAGNELVQGIVDKHILELQYMEQQKMQILITSQPIIVVVTLTHTHTWTYGTSV